MDPDYLVKILTTRVYDVAIESPLERAPLLSQRLGNDVRLKREDLQSVFSFKLRGAYNKMAHMAPDLLARGVITDEVLYRFEFPERRRALMHFLPRLGQTWNISVFHYRNHGADVRRVLAGIQVPASEQAAFQEFLAQVGYPAVEESANPAYRLFLSTAHRTAAQVRTPSI